MKVSVAGTITKVTTMADKTIRLQVDCQEMPADQMAEVFGLKDSLGYFFFDEKVIREIDKTDVPEINLEKWEKSPSQRLRAVLFRLWEQKVDRKQTDLQFETWYRERMEMIINKTKENLE